jgi:hypothetical protein
VIGDELAPASADRAELQLVVAAVVTSDRGRVGGPAQRLPTAVAAGARNTAGRSIRGNDQPCPARGRRAQFGRFREIAATSPAAGIGSDPARARCGVAAGRGKCGAIYNMTIDSSDLYAFPSQEAYDFIVDGEIVGVAVKALDDVVEFAWFGRTLPAVPPGTGYPSDPILSEGDGLHRLAPGTTLDHFAAERGLELHPRRWLHSGQAVAAYGLSRHHAQHAWHVQADRDGLELLNGQELEMKKLRLDDGPRTVWVWRAAARVRNVLGASVSRPPG